MRATIALALMLLAPGRVCAQGRIEVAFGALWTGGTSMGSISATETQSDSTARTVFGVSREVGATLGVDARIGVRATPRLDVEATGSYARPQLRLTTSGDVEGAPAVTASEQLHQFTVGGAATWFLARRTAAVRTTPFVAAGVAFARQLHESGTLAANGTMVEAGGGIVRLVAVRGRGRRAVGVRAEARARVLPQSFALDQRAHVTPVLAASVWARF